MIAHGMLILKMIRLRVAHSEDVLIAFSRFRNCVRSLFNNLFLVQAIYISYYINDKSIRFLRKNVSHLNSVPHCVSIVDFFS